jgi:hypothetical protein
MRLNTPGTELWISILLIFLTSNNEYAIFASLCPEQSVYV